jgi:hypothetical protein
MSPEYDSRDVDGPSLRSPLCIRNKYKTPTGYYSPLRGASSSCWSDRARLITSTVGESDKLMRCANDHAPKMGFVVLHGILQALPVSNNKYHLTDY